MSDEILVSRDGAIATVTINRPDRMNALNLPVWRQLTEAFLDLSTECDVRAIILRGAGTKAFAPGADIEEFDTLRANADQAAATDLGSVITLVNELRAALVEKGLIKGEA